MMVQALSLGLAEAVECKVFLDLGRVGVSIFRRQCRVACESPRHVNGVMRVSIPGPAGAGAGGGGRQL